MIFSIGILPPPDSSLVGHVVTFFTSDFLANTVIILFHKRPHSLHMWPLVSIWVWAMICWDAHVNCVWFPIRDDCLLLNSFSSNTLLIHPLSNTCHTLSFYERWWDGIWKTASWMSLGRRMHKCMNTVGQGPQKHDVNKDSRLEILCNCFSLCHLHLLWDSSFKAITLRQRIGDAITSTETARGDIQSRPLLHPNRAVLQGNEFPSDGREYKNTDVCDM